MGFMDRADLNYFLVGFQNAMEVRPNMELEEAKRMNWRVSGTMFDNSMKE